MQLKNRVTYCHEMGTGTGVGIWNVTSFGWENRNTRKNIREYINK
jgi:hypothetical protein